MTDEDRKRLRANALVELHDAIQAEREHEARLKSLVNILDRTARAFERGRLKAREDAEQHVLEIPAAGGDKPEPVMLPSQEELFAAVIEHDESRDRVANARQQCDTLNIDLSSLASRE